MNVQLMTGLLQGGAATGAIHLAQSLVELGTEIELVFPGRLKSELPAIDTSYFKPATWDAPLAKRIASWLRFRSHRQDFKRRMRRRPDGFEIFSSPRGAPITPWPPRRTPTVSKIDSSPEILHLHWVAKLIDYESFFGSIPAQTPVVWTLHDMNPITGGCHFSEACSGYQSGCNSCPQLSKADQSLSREFYSTKSRALENTNLHMVAPSRWLIDCARSSPLVKRAKSFHLIPYGLPTTVGESVVPRTAARQALGISDEAFVICFGAADVNNHRKGARFLKPALEQLLKRTSRPVVGLLFGTGKLDGLPGDIRQLGYLATEKSKMDAYCASDVFVIPSTQDNLPFTAIEAMTGGSALLGFNVSGIPDLIVDHETGRLATAGDASDLADKLCQMESDSEATRNQGQRAQEIAVERFTGIREAEDYRRLYAALLDAPDSVGNLPTCVGS